MAHLAQYQKKKKQSKNGQTNLNRHLSEEDIQMKEQRTHENMLNFANYQRNENQNYNEASPDTASHIHQDEWPSS